MYRFFGKRLLDVILSLALIVILSPLMIIIAAIVRSKMGSPVFFSQDRIGKNEKIFKMYKFRSMNNLTDELGNLLTEDKRLTSFGKLIRSTSIDELPELFAILFGKMSFIGPRPLRACDLPYYFEEERIIHTVRGGLVPPDVLSGKTILSYKEQFEYECYYVKNISFLLDLKVLLATFKVLLNRTKENYGDDKRPHLNEVRSKSNDN